MKRVISLLAFVMLFGTAPPATPQGPPPSWMAGGPQGPGPQMFMRQMGGPQGGGFLGVAIRDLDEDYQDKGLSEPCCVLVMEVRDESPADKAGLKPGDIITKFAGQDILSAMQFTRLVRELPPGRTVPLSVLRDGKKVDLKATIGRQGVSGFGSAPPLGFPPNFGRGLETEPGGQLTPFGGMPLLPGRSYPFPNGLAQGQWPGGPPFRVFQNPPQTWPSGHSPEIDLLTGTEHARLGVQVYALTDGLREFFGVESGVLVAGVQKDSPAVSAGLKAGDVITRLGDRAVNSPDWLAHEILGSTGKVTLDIVREHKPMTLNVELPERKAAYFYRRFGSPGAVPGPDPPPPPPPDEPPESGLY